MPNYLTTFDLKRGPRVLPKHHKNEMKFSLKTLNFHQCPICLSYMKKTYIVMECLHRFCGDCIQKCLRMGMKECPSCRVHIPSRRSLRPDTTYDTIMEGIYGDIESLEAREAKDIEEFNKKNNMNNSYSQSRHVKKLQQANQRKNKNNSNKGNESSIAATFHTTHNTTGSTANNNSTSNLESKKYNEQQMILHNHGVNSNIHGHGHGYNNTHNDTNNLGLNPNLGKNKNTNQTLNPLEQNPPNNLQKVQTVQIHNLQESTLVEFILRKDPRENTVGRLYRECLKVSEDITIGHLKRFLSRKLSYCNYCTSASTSASRSYSKRTKISKGSSNSSSITQSKSYTDFQITVNAGGRQVVLDECIKLKQVRTEICDYFEGMMIILQYFVQPFTLPNASVIEIHDDDNGYDDGHDNSHNGGHDNDNGDRRDNKNWEEENGIKST